MGGTPDGFSLIGDVPDRPGQHIIAGFNGAGMLFIFLSSQGLARMVTDNVPFEETGIPRIFKFTSDRLQDMIEASKAPRPIQQRKDQGFVSIY